jgi:hypothetical protein
MREGHSKISVYLESHREAEVPIFRTKVEGAGQLTLTDLERAPDFCPDPRVQRRRPFKQVKIATRWSKQQDETIEKKGTFSLHICRPPEKPGYELGGQRLWELHWKEVQGEYEPFSPLSSTYYERITWKQLSLTSNNVMPASTQSEGINFIPKAVMTGSEGENKGCAAIISASCLANGMIWPSELTKNEELYSGNSVESPGQINFVKVLEVGDRIELLTNLYYETYDPDGIEWIRMDVYWAV